MLIISAFKELSYLLQHAKQIIFLSLEVLSFLLSLWCNLWRLFLQCREPFLQEREMQHSITTQYVRTLQYRWGCGPERILQTANSIQQLPLLFLVISSCFAQQISQIWQLYFHAQHVVRLMTSNHLWKHKDFKWSPSKLLKGFTVSWYLFLWHLPWDN